MPDYTWVGIYLLDGNELVLGPFVGKPSPHTRIPLGRGICGAAATEKATIIVDDVNADPRYLACSLETQSEIVVPIMRGGEVLGEIDIDSDQPAAFGAADRALLEAVARACSPRASSDAPQATDDPHHHADSRRRHRPGSHRSGRPHPQGRRRSTIEWERHDAGVIAFKRYGQSLPADAARLDQAQQGRAQGAGDDADRRGLHQRQRRAAQGARPLREPAAGLEPAGRRRAASRTSTWSSSARTPRISTPGLEHEVVPGVVESLKIITEQASTRIARFAFEYARAARPQARHRDPQGEHHEAQRRPVPRQRAQGRRASITDIAYDERIVDAACMHLVMHPEQFDVLLLPNLYGDIVSDLCAGLVGGLGVVPGANLGAEIGGVRGGARQRARHRRTRTSRTRRRCCSRRC